MKLKKIIIGSLIFSAGFASSLIVVQVLNPDISLQNLGAIRDKNNVYEYVSPLLMCGMSEQVESSSFETLKESVETDLASIVRPTDTVSVYFRELNSGEWFSINEDEKFSPASLLKVPLYIAYMKMAESEPEVLNTELTLDELDRDENQNFKPERPLSPGQSYKVSELLTAALTESDNNATAALNANMDVNFKNEVYTDLGLDIPPDNADEEFMSAKDYSHFFRILYNASYLSDKDSEDTLKVMSQARFPDGLAGALPNDITISEKFGERQLNDIDSDARLYELHDCGIIYTNSPYLLCVMTKSPDSFEHLSELIQTISQTVYNEMTSPRAETFSVVKS